MKARTRSSYAAALNSQSALPTLLERTRFVRKRGETCSIFFILIPDLRVFGSRQT